MANRRTTARTRTWGAWSGDVNELSVLVGIVRDSIKERQVQYVGDLKDVLAEYDSRGDLTLQEVNHQKRLRAAVTMIESEKIDRFVNVTVIDKNETVYGQSEPVLAELDRRSTQAVIITGVPHTYIDTRQFRRNEGVPDGISLRLGAAGRNSESAVELDVASSSTGWARSTFARLSDELEKGVPRWAFLRKGALSSVWLTALFTAVLWIATVTAISDRLPRDSDASTLLIFAVGIFLLGVILSPIRNVVDWVLPRFELTGEGGTSSGTRRALSLLTILVSIPIGVFVNSVS